MDTFNGLIGNIRAGKIVSNENEKMSLRVVIERGLCSAIDKVKFDSKHEIIRTMRNIVCIKISLNNSFDHSSSLASTLCVLPIQIYDLYFILAYPFFITEIFRSSLDIDEDTVSLSINKYFSLLSLATDFEKALWKN